MTALAEGSKPKILCFAQNDNDDDEAAVFAKLLRTNQTYGYNMILYRNLRGKSTALRNMRR
jgi:hypothetical protein